MTNHNEAAKHARESVRLLRFTRERRCFQRPAHRADRVPRDRRVLPALGRCAPLAVRLARRGTGAQRQRRGHPRRVPSAVVGLHLGLARDDRPTRGDLWSQCRSVLGRHPPQPVPPRFDHRVAKTSLCGLRTRDAIATPPTCATCLTRAGASHDSSPAERSTSNGAMTCSAPRSSARSRSSAKQPGG